MTEFQLLAQIPWHSWIFGLLTVLVVAVMSTGTPVTDWRTITKTSALVAVAVPMALVGVGLLAFLFVLLSV